MNPQEMTRLFQQAKLLYIMKEYQDALGILEQLELYAPTSTTLRYAKAKCYAALGYRAEAKKICGELITGKEGADAASLMAQLIKE